MLPSVHVSAYADQKVPITCKTVLQLKLCVKGFLVSSNLFVNKFANSQQFSLKTVKYELLLNKSIFNGKIKKKTKKLSYLSIREPSCFAE